MISNTPRLCAERGLLKEVQRSLTSRGVPSRQQAWRAHRLLDGMEIRRVRADGTDGCSLPCAACRVALARWGVRRVKCTDGDGAPVRLCLDEMDRTFGPGKLCWCDRSAGLAS